MLLLCLFQFPCLYVCPRGVPKCSFYSLYCVSLVFPLLCVSHVYSLIYVLIILPSLCVSIKSICYVCLSVDYFLLCVSVLFPVSMSVYVRSFSLFVFVSPWSPCVFLLFRLLCVPCIPFALYVPFIPFIMCVNYIALTLCVHNIHILCVSFSRLFLTLGVRLISFFNVCLCHFLFSVCQ